MSLAEHGLTPEGAAVIAMAGRVLGDCLMRHMTPDEHERYMCVIAGGLLEERNLLKRVHAMTNALLNEGLSATKVAPP